MLKGKKFNAFALTQLVLDADGENRQVVDLHGDALQGKFTDADYHVGEHALDGTGRERRVVARHVGGKAVHSDGLSYYRVCVVFAVRIRHLLVLVFL